MQLNGIRENQVTQVRGFADQRLRDKANPMDPANRRISLIVQYLDKKEPDTSTTGNKPAEAKPGAEAPKPAEKPVEKK
jgi:chemotaxis protein MotB